MAFKKIKEDQEESDWVDFDLKPPQMGQKIRVSRQMQYEGIWNGDEVMREKPGQRFKWEVKAFWQPCD